MTGNGISETASEKKRGRPKVLDAVHEQIAKSCNHDVRTTRGLQNIHYRLRAQNCLIDDERFKWLCDRDAMAKGAPNAWKPGILSELGRLDDDETIKAYAARICELKPKTKDAITMLRRARTGKAPDASVLDLTARLCRVVDDYVAAHLDVTARQLLVALANTRDAVEETFGKSEEAGEVI